MLEVLQKYVNEYFDTEMEKFIPIKVRYLIKEFFGYPLQWWGLVKLGLLITVIKSKHYFRGRLQNKFVILSGLWPLRKGEGGVREFRSANLGRKNNFEFL